MALWLGEDLVRLVATQRPGGELATRMALVCRCWRHAIEEGDGGAFSIRRALLSIGETALMSELMATLALSAQTIKLAPHAKKRNRYGGFFNIFRHNEAVRLFHLHGGWDRLHRRLERRATRKPKALARASQ